MPSLCGPGHMGKSSKHLDHFLRWKSYFSLQFHPSEDFNREQRGTNARKKYQASGRSWELQSSIPKLANTAELLRTLSTPTSLLWKTKEISLWLLSKVVLVEMKTPQQNAEDFQGMNTRSGRKA